jgi:DNA modification methylase
MKVEMSDKQYEDYLKYLTYPVNILEIPKPRKKEYGEFNHHPTIKPVKIMEWLVKLQSNEGDTVLDPFNGSGTTGVACCNLGRKYIGLEMNKEYIDISKQRCNELAEFILGDCIESMRKIEDNSIDCIITDPPYALKLANWDTFDTMEHFAEFTRGWGIECFRILKPGGTISSFNAARTYHWLACGLDRAGFECRDMIEWVYWTGMPKGKNLKGCHEPIYMGWKPTKAVSDMKYNLDAVRIPAVLNKDKVKINKFEMVIEYD